jgi:RimJ/RimL family protein N-acetyltransferase
LSAVENLIALRPATLGDAETVFSWRNDPFIVARGSSQKTVTWEEHMRWFEETLSGSQRKMLIVLVDGEPRGQVRFDRVDGETCAISAYLLQQFTGRGLGVEAIRRGCEMLFGDWQVAKIVACVREDNPEGRAGFRKAGFRETTQTNLCPPGHFTLVLRRGVRNDGEAGCL